MVSSVASIALVLFTAPLSAVAEKKVAGEKCVNHGDCDSGCCFANHEGVTYSNICCNGYKAYRKDWSRFFKAQYPFRFCTRLANLGEECDNDESCETNKCVSYKCSHQKRAIGEPCQIARDCESNKCSAKSADVGSGPVCCTASQYNIKRAYNYCLHCADNGQACLANGMCKSSICIHSTCRPERLASGMECVEHNDCHSGSCYFKSAAPNSISVCCKTMASHKYNLRGFNYCIHLAESAIDGGEQCTADDMCDSSKCVLGRCRPERLNVGESCKNNGDCQSKACYLMDAGLDKRNICCDGVKGYSGWTPLSRYCNGMADNHEPCDRDTMCASGTCDKESHTCSGTPREELHHGKSGYLRQQDSNPYK